MLVDVGDEAGEDTHLLRALVLNVLVQHCQFLLLFLHDCVPFLWLEAFGDFGGGLVFDTRVVLLDDVVFFFETVDELSEVWDLEFKVIGLV